MERSGLFRKIIDKLFCCHDYELEKEIREGLCEDTGLPKHITFLYKCKKCGKFKKIRV